MDHTTPYAHETWLTYQRRKTEVCVGKLRLSRTNLMAGDAEPYASHDCGPTSLSARLGPYESIVPPATALRRHLVERASDDGGHLDEPGRERMSRTPPPTRWARCWSKLAALANATRRVTRAKTSLSRSLASAGRSVRRSARSLLDYRSTSSITARLSLDHRSTTARLPLDQRLDHRAGAEHGSGGMTCGSSSRALP
jgi:hypothetical protein